MTATLRLDPEAVTGPVRPRLFGSFVEHLGRCVYGGIYDPGHPAADADGLRTDVLALVRELGVTVVRYPGGNFVSGYRWEDGVGPPGSRPRRLDPAWHSIETNEFGLGEFQRFAAKAGVATMLAVNLGTRGVLEARDLLEYANHPAGTHLSDLRVAHGAPEPYRIGLWCLGNELDGDWQVGHKTATEYGRLAAETARALRQVQPDLELVACGSSGPGMATFGAWESTVLEHCYDLVDHVSAHLYVEERGDRASFLASATELDAMIDAVVATADAVGVRLRSPKKIMVSVDEWNVWYASRMSRWVPDEWVVAPPISEDPYTVVDAVVVGNLLISLLRHADRVAVACQAQLVNAIAPIRADPDGPAWRQATFHPFALTARYARGRVLRADLAGPRRHTDRYGEVAVVDAVATHDPDTGELCVFAVNRDQRDAVELTVDLAALGDLRPLEHTVLADADPAATNSATDPDRVRPATLPLAAPRDGRLTVALPALSWNLLRLRAAPGPRRPRVSAV